MRFASKTLTLRTFLRAGRSLREKTTVDETGNENAGPATVEIYNASGVLVASLCAEAVGTRFEL
jgi:hypothetical protein